MKTSQHFLLAVLSGLLLTFSWFPYGHAIVIFIAFVPLLVLEQDYFKHPQRQNSFSLFSWVYLSFFIWNVITTWWIKNASFGGAAMAILANALLMTMVFLLFHKVKKRLGKKWGNTVFICFWLTFEYFHLDWDLTWPWLTLGNVFADTPNWIQWYEYTGVFGGGLWILLANYLLFSAVEEYIGNDKNSKSIQKKITGFVFLVAIPIMISYALLPFVKEPTGKKINVVLVQPNIDPYSEKFVDGFEEQLQKMIALAAKKVDSTTDYLLFPETALTENLWEQNMDKSMSMLMLNDFIKQYPKLKIVTGASTAKMYEQGENTPTARKFVDAEIYYDAFNTALQVDSTKHIQIYHKSRLVPGVEKMPFPIVFKHIEKLAINLGGTSGSLGTQEERSVFYSADSTIKTAPVVCYESIYGEYVSEYVKNGAQFISIITNDSWWDDTPGYKQLLKYGALRAIETRRYIARSANMGVACFINHKGEVLQPTQWATLSVLKGYIVLNDKQTFYTQFGDFIARLAMYVSIAFLIYSAPFNFRKMKN